MAKIKSVKFYNFVELSGSNYTTFNVQFYDINEKLILIDFSKSTFLISTTYTENSEYIITSSSGYNSANYYNYHSFHTGNRNLNTNLPIIGCSWIPATLHAISNDFLKIEFKFPQYISKIEILPSPSNDRALDTLDCDIELDDNTIQTYHFKSNGIFAPYYDAEIDNFKWDQDVYDSLFSELEFSKSKQIYDSEIGLIETLDDNQFRNIPINTLEKLKILYNKPPGTFLSYLVSFDQKQTWKTFNGTNWIEISDISASNIILNGIDVEMLNQIDKNKLIAGGFTGDLDFKIAMKTNNENKTPSISKIYIKYK